MPRRLLLLAFAIGAFAASAAPADRRTQPDGEGDPAALNSCLSECEDADPGNRWSGILQEKVFATVTCVFDHGLSRDIVEAKCAYKGAWENREVTWKVGRTIRSIDKRGDICLDGEGRDRYACPEKADMPSREPSGRDASAREKVPLLRDGRVLASCHDKFLRASFPKCAAPPEPPRQCPCPAIDRALAMPAGRRAVERYQWLEVRSACGSKEKRPGSCRYSPAEIQCGLDTLDFADRVEAHCSRCPGACGPARRRAPGARRP
ncbi:MAG TPA: hypothetical protein VNI01_12425 [Elusimicrobiota bacterium]|nr:hypothetical protein [Elusimicrobiota bacterium]